MGWVLLLVLGCGARSGLRFDARGVDAGTPDTGPVDAGVDATVDTGPPPPPPPPECDEDADCADEIVCNGDERCVDGVCIVGTFIFCPSADPCFTGRCDEAASGCVYDATD